MKKVLLYSGGLDSLCASAILKPDLCVYVSVAGRYSAMEMAKMVKPAHGDLVVTGLEELGRFERPQDLILPQRNAFFVLMAAYYGEHIMLGATYGDRSSDKDQEFAGRMQFLLDHLWKEQHWLPDGRRFKVELPIKHWTKTELVRKYLAMGESPVALDQAISCYSGTSRNCGRCKPCARKWVALTNNGLFPEFDAEPSQYFTPEMVEKMEVGAYRGKKEDDEILRALKRANGC